MKPLCGMSPSTKYLRSPLFLCLIFVPVLLIICNPFFEIGVNDEWAYVGLARSLAYELEYHWAYDPRTMKPRRGH